jgi:8-oxo-dGTP pyrophosphatase MutT (NUDIX family)
MIFTPDFRAHIADRFTGFERLDMVEPSVPLKRAAVAITLVEAEDGSGDAAFLLTRRASTLRAHGGQWALPGGRCDPGETIAQAALRELHEELDLRLEEDAVLGVLDDYPTRSGYAIAPVIVWAGAGSVTRPNPDEVESVHRIRLGEIARPEATEFVTIPESDRPVIRLHFGDRAIHAPTAAVLYQFVELIAGRTTRVHELEQPVFAWK